MITTTGCNIDCISDNICLYQVGGGGGGGINSYTTAQCLPFTYYTAVVSKVWCN